MAAAISEFFQLFRDHFGPVPLLMLLLSSAGLCVWHQRSRMKVLVDRLNLADERWRLMEERKLFSDEKRACAEKELELLLCKFGPVAQGFPRLFDSTHNGRRIVSIVEDEQAVHIYKPVLEQALANTEVRLANNGLEALDQIGRQRPDLIITDVLMPEMNGYAFLKELSARYSEIPVLVVSAYIDNLQQIIDKTDVRNLRLEFLPKPFLCRDLVSAIHRLTNNRLRLEAAAA